MKFSFFFQSGSLFEINNSTSSNSHCRFNKEPQRQLQIQKVILIIQKLKTGLRFWNHSNCFRHQELVIMKWSKFLSQTKQLILQFMCKQRCMQLQIQTLSLIIWMFEQFFHLVRLLKRLYLLSCKIKLIKLWI